MIYGVKGSREIKQTELSLPNYVVDVQSIAQLRLGTSLDGLIALLVCLQCSCE